jgi:subtilisin family serine protease
MGDNVGEHRMDRVQSIRARLLAALVATTTAIALLPGSTASAVAPPHGDLRLGRRVELNSTPTPQFLRESAPPDGVPKHGRYAFLLQLGTASTFATYRSHLAQGKAAAASEGRAQLHRIQLAQAGVVAALPAHSRVLYKTHSTLAAVAITTDVRNYRSLFDLSGVQAVYPIAPKSVSNSYAMALQHAPQSWQAHGDLGANSTIAVIDTGIDYTHANFGGPGTPGAYASARANDTVTPTYPDPNKIVGGYDFVGDAYDPTDPNHDTPVPDDNPLDCDGHGSHVAGIAAGYGENPDGSTFTGDYTSLGALSTAAYQAHFRIGPGMAPEAKLLAYKIFGCTGPTDMIGAAIDRAADPNQDGDPSDHADVINLSVGSTFGSPQDGDAVEANLASALGITVVTAAGNDGDSYDIGGAPGVAVRTIDVADAVDAYSQIDTLHASVNGSPSTFGAQRSDAYNWATDPDLSGSVAALDPTQSNLDGCDPLSFTDATRVNGKIAFLEWTDNSVVSRCSSATRSDNVAAAGAIGAILGDDAETFNGNIIGSAQIPVVLTTQSAADTIRTALQTSQPVTVSSTSAGDFSQMLPGNDDKLGDSSSRGIRNAGNVKPDVSAVGTSVFSTAMGTGDEGVSFTGTSMASPMVAGLAALVKSERKDWTPEEVKADIMNTAGQDLFTGDGHTGTTYAPNRVGAGRIEADGALRNLVVAYDASDPGAVSVSFGPVAVTAATTLTKSVTVSNKSFGNATFNVGYHPITSVPGVSYQVTPASITLGPAAKTTLTVKLVITNPAALTKTHDGTRTASIDLGAPKPFTFETLADASGRIELTPAGGYAGPALRVPVYSAPRPASTMTQPAALSLPGTGVQSMGMTLSGHGLNQGVLGSTLVRSYSAGFELQATSGAAPACVTPDAQGCIHIPDDRSADIKYVGFTSDSPIAPLYNLPSFDGGEGYFAITTQAPWRTPSGPQEFDILIDTNNDGNPDAVVFNTRFGSSDLFLSVLVDIQDPNPNNWFVRDARFINDRTGDVDTALFDSDTMVLPVWLGALGGDAGYPALPGFDSTHTRIHYGILTFGRYGLVDAIGAAPNGALNAQRMTVDLMHPAVEVTNPGIGNVATDGLLLNPDQNGTVLTVRRDVNVYNADHATGMLLVHFDNLVGTKARVVVLKSAPRVALKLSAASIALHHAIAATITVANTGGHVPTGALTLRTAAGVPIKAGNLVNGKVVLTWAPGARGTFGVYATYAGDANYGAGKTASAVYRVL